MLNMKGGVQQCSILGLYINDLFPILLDPIIFAHGTDLFYLHQDIITSSFKLLTLN